MRYLLVLISIFSFANYEDGLIKMPNFKNRLANENRDIELYRQRDRRLRNEIPLQFATQANDLQNLIGNQSVPDHYKVPFTLEERNLKKFFGESFKKSYLLSTGTSSQVYIVDTGISPYATSLDHAIRETTSLDLTNSDSGIFESCTLSSGQKSGRGHGTHIAGIIAMKSSEEHSGMGICPDCNLNIIKVFSDRCRFSGPVSGKAFLEPVKSGASVINISWGFPPSIVPDLNVEDCLELESSPNFSRETLQQYCLALKVADERGTVIVGSVGNNDGTREDNQEVTFPASDPRVVAVGASIFNFNVGVHEAFYGCSFFDDPLECNQNSGAAMEFSAPGVNIVSTMFPEYSWNNGLNFPCSESGYSTAGYGTCTGASMSTPFITGIFGLLKSLAPLASNSELRKLLRFYTNKKCDDTSDDSECRDEYFGFGIPQVELALRELLEKHGELTPLFRITSSDRTKNFYSIMPQLMMAKLDSEEDWRPAGNIISPRYPKYKFGLSLAKETLGQPINGLDATFDFYVFSRESSTRVPLYRLFNPTTGETFYTTSDDEKHNKQFEGFEFLGIEGFLNQNSFEDYMLGQEFTAVYRVTRPKPDGFGTYSTLELEGKLIPGNATKTLLGYSIPIRQSGDEFNISNRILEILFSVERYTPPPLPSWIDLGSDQLGPTTPRKMP